MSQTITLAAVQMEVAVSPTADRLDRAERLVAQASARGAQLVLLPELFNTGYTYDDSNFARAEPLGGPTASWMRAAAARYDVHLAGSMLLREGHDIYNAMLLWSPAGAMWRYDKVFPWGWERAYFRPSHHQSVIATTELGRIGLTICWDSAHRELWAKYAGQVDFMLIASCPPDVTNPSYQLRDGTVLHANDMGPLIGSVRDSGPRLFGPMIDEQTAWLGVPMVNTVGSGQFHSRLPASQAMFCATLPTAPWLFRHLAAADEIRISCDMIAECKIVDAHGVPIARIAPDTEDIVLATVALADSPLRPWRPQPPSQLPPMTYVLSDIMLPGMTAPHYARMTQVEHAHTSNTSEKPSP